jgi:hypothetical protein
MLTMSILLISFSKLLLNCITVNSVSFSTILDLKEFDRFKKMVMQWEKFSKERHDKNCKL